MKFALWTVSLVGLMAIFAGGAPNALATTCPAMPTCTAGGTTFTPEDVVEISGANGVTAIATFDTADQSNSTIETEVDAYLGDLGVTGVTYLGRYAAGPDNGTQTGPGNSGPAGTSITIASGDSGLSGTWTFGAETTGDTASFVAIHAGGGQNDTLYEFNTQESLSGSWTTAGNGNGSANLSNFDLFGGTGSLIIGGGGAAAPEPASLSLLGAGLLGVGFLRRRMRG